MCASSIGNDLGNVKLVLVTMHAYYYGLAMLHSIQGRVLIPNAHIHFLRYTQHRHILIDLKTLTYMHAHADACAHTNSCMHANGNTPIISLRHLKCSRPGLAPPCV